MGALQAEFGQSAIPWGILALRLLGAVILSGAIGFEREAKNMPAGLRTNALVGLAAACYALAALDLTGRHYAANVRMDPIRLVEAVTSGVAFLAAGLIVFARGEVHGLTTGASLWLSAALGLTVGLGLWQLALTTAGLGLLVVLALKRAERRMHRKAGKGGGPGD